MKKALFITVFLMAGMLQAVAQRYLPGMRGMQAMGGLIESSGYFLHAGYAQYTKKQNRFVFDAEYLQRNHSSELGNIPMMQFTVEGGYFFRMYNDYSRTFIVAVGATALTGYETINLNKKILSNGSVIVNDDHWIYGAALAIEAEYYLDDRYTLLFTIKQRLSAGSTVSTFHTLFGIGIKYILE